MSCNILSERGLVDLLNLITVKPSSLLGKPVLHFWSPHLDPAHPQDCTQPERYVIQVLASGRFLAIASDGQSLMEVAAPEAAHLFHAHEAALRAAKELNAEGRGPVDVVKLELDVS
jgi:hypothetical protein